MKTFKNIFSMAIPLVWLFILISPGGAGAAIIQA